MAIRFRRSWAFWEPAQVPIAPRSTPDQQIVYLRFNWFSATYKGLVQTVCQLAPGASAYAEELEHTISQDISTEVRPYLICRVLMGFIACWCFAIGIMTVAGETYYFGWQVLIAIAWIRLIRWLMCKMETSLGAIVSLERNKVLQFNRMQFGSDVQIICGVDMRWLEIRSRRYQPPRINAVPVGIAV